MKQNNLINLIVGSDVRKDIIFLLYEKSMSLTEIRERMNRTSPEIIPRIKELEKNGLISKNNHTYHITPLGSIFIEKVRPLFDTFHAINNNWSFFRDHDLRSIPLNMLNRVNEFCECRVVENNVNNLKAVDEEMRQMLMEARSIKAISSVFNPLYAGLLTERVKTGCSATVILSSNIQNTIIREHDGLLKEYLRYDKGGIFISNRVKMAFLLTDTTCSFSLYMVNGSFDMNTLILSRHPSALAWGNDLFHYFKNTS